jgi:hypothetical protein
VPWQLRGKSYLMKQKDTKVFLSLVPFAFGDRLIYFVGVLVTVCVGQRVSVGSGVQVGVRV